jgi:aspartyl-tRNA(Asn)/glutamyl-tRNA(Gln) amidotransferase subunit A
MSVTARIEQVLADIRARDKAINAFVDLTEDRALAQARRVDRFLEAGRGPGKLSGIPFAVKNLFDVKGLATLSGSKLNRELPPAARDATLVTRLENAGAVLVGTLNMDEYAYGFSTENSHYGPTRNPHNPARVAGGSSGGSAACSGRGPGSAHAGLGHEWIDTGARLVLRGVGVETHLRAALPRRHVPVRRLARPCRSVRAIGCRPRRCLRRHAGHRPRRSVCRPPRAVDTVCDRLDTGIEGLRIARAVGYFEDGAEPAWCERVAGAAAALGATRTVEIPEAAHGRAAAFVITACEGAQLHLPNLRKRAGDFEPLIRDRLLAARSCLPRGTCRRSAFAGGTTGG